LNYDVDTLDWKGDYNAAENNFLNPVSSGKPSSNSYIVLSHDIHQETVTTLVPYMISKVKSLGYKFATAGQCLGDPLTNWYRDPLTGEPVTAAKLQAVGKSTQAGNASTTILPSATASGNFNAGSSPLATPVAVQNVTVKTNSTKTSTGALKASGYSGYNSLALIELLLMSMVAAVCL
jgi:hypothetical protein